MSEMNKPGTSCLGCRRRKLKCTRELESCSNCTKSDLPCVYPTPEIGVKRKRGPYKKDKPARQRHLEDLVKYLEPRISSSDLPDQVCPDGSGRLVSPGHAELSTPAAFSQIAPFRPSQQTDFSEELVKDALIALTKSSVSDQESRTDNGVFHPSHAGLEAQASNHRSHHPPLRRIFEYWQLFVSRVDPLTKVIHRPTFGNKLLTLLDDLGNVSSSMEALLFSVYYAAVCTCTASEAQRRFGESQEDLMRRYGRQIEDALGQSDELPTIEALQALVLYLICIQRRGSNAADVRALFQLAVRSGQIIGAHQDPGEKYPPLEAELRRRAWYHLNGLENTTAEEGQTRMKSATRYFDVRIPSNFNDCDLNPQMTKMPEARKGLTDMTFPIVRFELQKLILELCAFRLQERSATDIRAEQLKILDRSKHRIHEQYVMYLDTSRPYDLMCRDFIEAMLIKARLIVDFPFGTVPTKEMAPDQRIRLLEASVKIIRTTYNLTIKEHIGDLVWYFRGFVQWHSLAVVVAEISHFTNPDFTDMAWQVLDTILADWDKGYELKKGERAWDHVNTMITKARHIRLQRKQSKRPKTNYSESLRHSQAGKTPRQASSHAEIFAPTYETPRESAPEGLTDLTLPIDPQLPSACRYVQSPSTDTGPESTSTSTKNADMDGSDFDTLGSIDFDAFDKVFGSSSWEWLRAFDDVNMEAELVARCSIGHGA